MAEKTVSEEDSLYTKLKHRLNRSKHKLPTIQSSYLKF